MKEDEKFEKLILEMFTRLMEENPEYATFLGLHDPYGMQECNPSFSTFRCFQCALATLALGIFV